LVNISLSDTSSKKNKNIEGILLLNNKYMVIQDILIITKYA
jgi:hypothetical protein